MVGVKVSLSYEPIAYEVFQRNKPSRIFTERLSAEKIAKQCGGRVYPLYRLFAYVAAPATAEEE